MTIKISQLGTVASVQGNVLVPVVSNITGTQTTVSANIDVIKTFIVAGVEANVAAANAASTFANTIMKGYVTGQITAANAGVTAANIGMQGYVDQSNVTLKTYVDGQITSANSAVVAANLGMKGYVDSISGSESIANVNMKGYVDGQITAANTGVTSANIGMKGYVDNQVTAANTQANTANIAMAGYVNNQVTTANVGMKGYVDAAVVSVGGSTYGNANVAQFLPTYSGNVGQLLNVGNFTVYGNITAGFALPIVNYANVIFLGTGTANGYSQLNIQNIDSTGTQTSADFIATAPNGTDSTHYIDMGINGNNYSSSSWTISGANDGYVYINQGNLTLGTDTASTTVKVHVGGTLAGNVVTTFTSNGQSTAGNITATYFIGDGSQLINLPATSYGNAQVQTYLGNITGNLIPSANVTYDLGSVTNRWRDLYLSGNTIFLGDATITTESGRLVTTGAAISPPTGAVGFANVQFEAPTDFSAISSYFASFGYTANLINYASAPIVWDELRSAKFYENSLIIGGAIPDFSALDTSGGRFANAVATIDATGNIASLTITDGGLGYDSYYPYYATDPTGYDNNYIGQSYTGAPTGKSYRRISLIPTTASDVGNITSIGSFSRYDGCPTVGSNSYTWTGNTGTTISFTVDWSSNTVTSYTYTPALPALTSANDWQNWVLDYQNTNDYGWWIGSGSSQSLSVSSSSAIYDYLSREALPNSLTYDLSNTTWYPGNLLVNNSASTATLSSQTLFVSFNRTAIGYATVENSYGNPVYWSRGLSADTGISSGGDMTVAGDLRVTGDLYVSPTSIYMGDLQISATDGNLKVNTGFKFSDNTVQTTAYTGSTYGNTQVAQYLPTYTGNVQAGNVKVTSAYRFATGAVTITNGDSHVELTPDTGANALAGVKIGGGGYLLGPNNSRCITLNYGSVGGAVGLQANVTIGTGGSGNLVVLGRVTAGNVTANYISGDGSAITSLSGAEVSGNVASASLAYTVNISPVIVNLEYQLALLPAKEGAWGIKAADGTANVTYNPVSNRLTSANVQATGSIQTSGINGRIGYSAGGFVQQITANTNGVSLNTVTGNIQLMGINLGVNGLHTVALTNNKLEETDMILVSHHSGGVSNFAVGAYYAAPSTAIIWIRNITGADTSTVTPMLKFALIKAPGA